MKKKSKNRRIRYDDIDYTSADVTSYVYFSTILKENHNSPQYKLGVQAQAALSSFSEKLLSKSNSENGESEGKIVAALNFLKQAAEFERSKEIQFFQNYKSQYSNVFDNFHFDSISGENFDYQQFIVDINVSLRGIGAVKSEINAELDRINRMRDADQAVRKKYKNPKNMTEKEKAAYLEDIENTRKESMTAGGTKAYAGGEAFYLKRASDSTIRGLTTKDSTLNAEITQLIINEYGPQLFSVQGGKLRLNAQQLTILIKVISDKIYASLMSQYQSAKKGETTSKRLQQITVSDDVRNFVEGLLSNIGLKSSLASIASQHNISDATIQEQKATDEEIQIVIEKLRQGYEKMRTAQMPPFEVWLEQHKEFNISEIVQASKAVKAQSYYTGENMSLMDLIMNGISGTLGGRENPTDDWEAGALIVNAEIDDTKLQHQIDTASREMNKLQEEYFNQITKTTDFASFHANTQKLRALREKQEKILKSLQQKAGKSEEAANYLLSHMNIHGTIKGYQSAGRDTFEYYGGFEGAAFGSDLTNQLNILTSAAGSGLLESAGISPEDKQWLRFAMINAGAQMLGARLKPTLENYFSIFVGFFMFNDAALMIEDAAAYMQNTYATGAQDLHMYQLNGLLVPASYLLQQTYNSLVPLKTNIEAQLDTSQSTRALLHTYNDGPQANSWKTTTEAAEKATYLEMKFLAGFLALLKQIADKVNQM